MGAAAAGGARSTSRRLGRAELANGGTLFLDELGELSADLQPAFLRLLQEGQFERLGGTETLRVNVRYVAATNRPLAQMAKEKTFREDLFGRLNGISITLPALRAHAEDIPMIAQDYLATLGPANGRPRAALTPGALALLAAQPWPGNVRELQNFIERLMVLAPRCEAITEVDVQRELDRDRTEAPAPASTRPNTREELEQTLIQTSGNRSQAARILGISRRTLYYRIDAHGLRGLLRETAGLRAAPR